jgi:hypothetical protein
MSECGEVVHKVGPLIDVVESSGRGYQISLEHEENKKGEYFGPNFGDKVSYDVNYSQEVLSGSNDGIFRRQSDTMASPISHVTLSQANHGWTVTDLRCGGKSKN